MRRNVIEIYHDESGERILELFRQAETRREAFRHNLRLAGFWTVVFGALISVVVLKLWTMGAIEGVK